METQQNHSFHTAGLGDWDSPKLPELTNIEVPMALFIEDCGQ